MIKPAPFVRSDLASFAADAGASPGRIVDEPSSATRTAFQRDRDRIVHSTAFRRLKHKTQVFVAYEGDHYRTRLTHTIEVSQIARAFARSLRLDEDLTEAIALAHDFGHTPFGHAGERALDAAMAGFGGFDHNDQTLRIVTSLERRYAAFDGLNLSMETLEGIAKHNGPLEGNHAGEGRAVTPTVRTIDGRLALHLDGFASLEAQAAAISDDIAYNTHDLDDGLRAGLIALDDLRALTLAGSILDEVRTAYPALDDVRTAHEVMRRHITRMVEDVIAASEARIAAGGIRTLRDVRAAPATILDFSPAMKATVAETRAFLFERLYRNPTVMRVMTAAEAIVSDLFVRYRDQPDAMGAAGAQLLAGEALQERTVCDYLAGMTDSYAIAEHRRLFDATPDLG